ncbi:MAG: phage tail protein [Bacteroidota bacterium]
MASPGTTMIRFDVDLFEDTLAAATGEMEKVVKLAIYSTVGKLRTHAASKLSELIREKWNIKKADLDRKIIIHVGDRGSRYETFEMTIKGVSISLSYFSAKQYRGKDVITRKGTTTRKRSATVQGVQVEVFKGRRTMLKSAFIQTAANGHMMVLRRKGKGRYPIDMKSVISIASMFGDATTADKFEEDVMAFIERTFAHELDWRMQQAGLA